MDPSTEGKSPACEAERIRRGMQRLRREDPIAYSDYLQVQKLLTLQKPRSTASGKEAHDEHLFIVIHQVYELWFKQILHELDSVIKIFSTIPVDEAKVGVAVHRLTRVCEIQDLLIQQISVLETMSPIDFLDFRDFLYPASGFQSAQFRLIENKLGLLPSQRLNYGSRGYCTYLAACDSEMVKASEREPSLYKLVEAWLERTPFLEMGAVEPDEVYDSAPFLHRAPPVASLNWSSEQNSTEDHGDSQATDNETHPSLMSPIQSKTDAVSYFSWWKMYKQAVEKTLLTDESAILSDIHLTPEQREVAEKECHSTREHFASILDKEIYEKAREKGQRRLSYRAMQAALLISLYQQEPIFQLPYRFLCLLQDIDEKFTAWRSRHAQMVHRMLGVKMGTGGSSGYHYLRATVDRHKVFSEFGNLATFLIPRYMMPPLPEPLKRQLAFAFSRQYTDNSTSTPMPVLHPIMGLNEVPSIDEGGDSVYALHAQAENINAAAKCPFLSGRS